jgi:isocitrate dehydrogenase
MKTTLNSLPESGEAISLADGKLNVPAHPIIPFIEGDGIGADVWPVAQRVLNAAVEQSYLGARRIAWMEIFAGQKASLRCGSWLPDETLQAFKTCRVGIKGPLGTPVGGGMRSLNVALRRELDLYVCLRPIRWFQGVPSPVVAPHNVDMVVFRENTEDLYAGIEFEQGSPDNLRFKTLFQEHFPQDYARMRFPDSSGIGIKPVSREGSQRLVRSALRYALANRRRSLTLVHKGNIMKYTEGAFRGWGYDLAESEFAGQVYTQRQFEHTKAGQGETVAEAERQAALASGKLPVKDIIADAMFEAALTRPAEFDVLATTNLNGDYLSDALAAQVGGIGIAPGANINYETGAAVFEATHGTAPTIAGQDKANPCSLILSGEMLLRYLGWGEAADRVVRGVEGAIASRALTADLFALVEGGALLKTSEFGEVVVKKMEAG